LEGVYHNLHLIIQVLILALHQIKVLLSHFEHIRPWIGEVRVLLAGVNGDQPKDEKPKDEEPEMREQCINKKGLASTDN